MQLLVFVLAYPILWIVSILPFPVFYKLSDLVCFFVYRVFGYRKKVVRENLAMALPHLSDAERLEIEKKFYSHMCDMFMEMIKTISMSEAEINKHFVCTNLEVLKEYEAKGKSVALMCAHYASWEWLIALSKKMTFKSVTIYKKINNKYFDDLIRKIRRNLNTELVETKESIEMMISNKRKGINAFYGFAGDQSPQIHRAKYWTEFMGIEVPVHTGGEMLAKKLDMNMIFVKVEKVKRGYYQCTIVPLAENPRDYKDFELTDLYLRQVEKQILEAPEYYFWTHKRWKHAGKKPAENTATA